MFDIEQYVHRRFDDYRYYGLPATDIQVNCPFCDEDTHFHLHINLIDQRKVHCFKCDYRRSWINFVMDYDHVSYHIAFSELYVKPNPIQITKFYDDLQLRADHQFVKQRRVKQLSLYGNFHYLYEPTKHEQVESARQYLLLRHFDDAHWKTYNLGVFLTGDYIGRVIVPIEEDFFQARAIYKYLKPRYLSPKDADNTSYLFNSTSLQLFDEIVVCEGAFSAMTIGENAIALVGKNPTIGKLRRLAESDVQRFVITVEKKAEANMLKVADFLTHEGRLVTLDVYEVGDPADQFAVSVRRDYSFSDKLRYKLQGNLT